MLSIGPLYFQSTGDQVRLCADISLEGRESTLWFGVESVRQAYLCHRRSDAFVMALLPTAMAGGHDIVCHTPVSSRLKYQLESYLLPALTAKGDPYRPIRISGPVEVEPVPSAGGVGLDFSGGTDCLYSLMTHGRDSAYPLTHLAVCNLGGSDPFPRIREEAAAFARALELEPVVLDSNLPELLQETYPQVSSFRKLSGALALQGLFSVYLLPSGQELGGFALDLHHGARYDLLTVHCSQTESLTIYLSGSQTGRADKLAALADWAPARSANTHKTPLSPEKEAVL